MHYKPFTNVCIQAFMLQHVPDAIFSLWYRNIKVAENFRGNISFVKTQTRLKLLCLSWICWRCERQSWAESIRLQWAKVEIKMLGR